LADVDSIAMCADGLEVSVLWQDNRLAEELDDIWFQHSSDGGATWRTDDVGLKSALTFPTDVDGEIGIAQLGMTIVTVWQEERSSKVNEELRTNVSYDMGVSWFNEDVLIGGYEPGVHDVDSARVFFCRDYPTTLLGGCKVAVPLIAWDDNRTGNDEVYVVHSIDSGMTWEETRLSESGGEEPVFTGGNDSVCLAWTNGSFPSTIDSAFSCDAGLSWSSGFSVSDNAGSDAHSPAVGFSGCYNNFIIAWLSDDLSADSAYIGGYRPQTLVAVGEFTAGEPVHFEAHHWSRNMALPVTTSTFSVLISSGTGDFLLPLEDQRNTGLLMDTILYASIGRARSRLSGLITSTSGMTTPFIFPNSPLMPPGTVLNCVAVEVRDTGGQLELGKITDVIEVLVQ